jgi:DNA-binding response OmpR family regulator
VVQDEPKSSDLVCLHLGLEGYACDALGDGRDVLARVEAEPFDLLVLDVVIPGIDGLSLCRAVRNGRLNQDVPILMLTARRDESDKVVGLESGADDYLTKPFGVRELVARTRALLRRPRGNGHNGVDNGTHDAHRAIQVRDVEIDPARRRVRVQGRDVALTDQEFRMLHLLASHAGIVFNRETLLEKVWRGDTFVGTRSVDTLVKRLRRRVEPDPSRPQYLVTVWGVGYKFADT